MLAQQFPGRRVQQSHALAVPLDTNATPNPAWRSSIVSCVDFHATVQVNGAFAVLVVAERFNGQGQQSGPLLVKHPRDLALGCAVNAGIGPTLFPVVEIVLRLLERL